MIKHNIRGLGGGLGFNFLPQQTGRQLAPLPLLRRCSWGAAKSSNADRLSDGSRRTAAAPASVPWLPPPRPPPGVREAVSARASAPTAAWAAAPVGTSLGCRDCSSAVLSDEAAAWKHAGGGIYSGAMAIQCVCCWGGGGD